MVSDSFQIRNGLKINRADLRGASAFLYSFDMLIFKVDAILVGNLFEPIDLG